MNLTAGHKLLAQTNKGISKNTPFVFPNEVRNPPKSLMYRHLVMEGV